MARRSIPGGKICFLGLLTSLSPSPYLPPPLSSLVLVLSCPPVHNPSVLWPGLARFPPMCHIVSQCRVMSCWLLTMFCWLLLMSFQAAWVRLEPATWERMESLDGRPTNPPKDSQVFGNSFKMKALRFGWYGYRRVIRVEYQRSESDVKY